MVYDKKLDKQLNEIISKWKNPDRKKMFGGICYLLNGNMLRGVYKDYIFLRLGEKNANGALKLSNFRSFDVSGRTMKGWVMAGQEIFKSNENLNKWVKKAKRFVEKLPAK